MKGLYSATTAQHLIDVVNYHIERNDGAMVQPNDHISIFDHRITSLKSYESVVLSNVNMNGLSFVAELAGAASLSELAVESIIAGKLIPEATCESVLAAAVARFGVDPRPYVSIDRPTSASAMAPLKPQGGLGSVIALLREKKLETMS
ncbi:MAG: hypothetical protein AAF968_09065 [Pseudomonadota bacterium]